MTELSPAAQAIDRAIADRIQLLGEIAPSRQIAAAALRAAASHLLVVRWNGRIPVSATEQIGINWARDALHVLANELEAQ